MSDFALDYGALSRPTFEPLDDAIDVDDGAFARAAAANMGRIDYAASSAGSGSSLGSLLSPISPLTPATPAMLDDADHKSLFAAMQEVYLNDPTAYVANHSPPPSPTKRGVTLTPPFGPIRTVAPALHRRTSMPALYLDSARASGKTLAARRAANAPRLVRRASQLSLGRPDEAAIDPALAADGYRPVKQARRTPPPEPREMDVLMADIGTMLQAPDSPPPRSPLSRVRRMSSFALPPSPTQQSTVATPARPKPFVLQSGHDYRTAPTVLSLAEAQSALASTAYQTPSYNVGGVKLAAEDLSMLDGIAQTGAPAWMSSFPAPVPYTVNGHGFGQLSFAPRPASPPLRPNFTLMRRGSSADDAMVPSPVSQIQASYPSHHQPAVGSYAVPSSSHYNLPSHPSSPITPQQRRRSSAASVRSLPASAAAPMFVNFSAADASTINRGVARSGQSKREAGESPSKRRVVSY